jgi:glycosyltransferase involved in cell wall biosynthesis
MTERPSSNTPASVVIPAHNEGTVIERCLDALFAGVDPGTLDVVVACNGCHDDTAQRARNSGHPVRVLELEQASKAAALRAGDEAARYFPRLYLDADVVLAGPSARRVIERLEQGAVAARPPVRYDASQSTFPVRCYYRARAQVPAVLRSLWGAGVYGLSADGRARFDAFPDITSDDLWIDLQFAPDEVEIVDCEPVVVSVPRRSRDLLTVLQRTYKGKAEHRPTPGVQTRARTTTVSAVHDLRRLAGSGIRGALDAITYAAFVVAARGAFSLRAALAPAAASAWERDESSR